MKLVYIPEKFTDNICKEDDRVLHGKQKQKQLIIIDPNGHLYNVEWAYSWELTAWNKGEQEAEQDLTRWRF